MSGAAHARRRLALALRRLEKANGRSAYRGGTSAVGELVATILSQNTSGANSSAGFRQLWRRFRSWPAVAQAPVEEIERCIRVCGLSRVKAPRIKTILQQIRVASRRAGTCKPCSGPQEGQHGRKRRGHGTRLSLEFLRDWPTDDAYRYLVSFDGVGPKTAACVLLFAFNKPVFPVDTHILRIAIRLGLLAVGTPAERAQELLTPFIRPRDRLAMHLLLIAHGRRTCRALGPRCQFCSLLDVCPFGQKHIHRRER